MKHHTEILIWVPEAIETYQCSTVSTLSKSISEDLNLSTLVSDYFLFPLQVWVVSQLGSLYTLRVNVLRIFYLAWLISNVKLNLCLNKATVGFLRVW